MSENKMDRRSFLGTSAKIGVVGVVGSSALLTACAGKKEPQMVALRQPGEYYVPELPDKAIEGKPLKAGVIGCGGRGSGAIMNLLDAADGITVTALGDTFADRLNSLKDKLKEQRNQVVPDENCFVGFDAYKKVIDSGVDMVVVATPPVFRPTHFQYAPISSMPPRRVSTLSLRSLSLSTLRATASSWPPPSRPRPRD